MKTLLYSCLATGAFIAFSACTTVEDRRGPSVRSTTTTEESTVRSPVSATRETQTIRAY